MKQIRQEQFKRIPMLSILSPQKVAQLDAVVSATAWGVALSRHGVWHCQGMGCGLVKAWGVALSRHGVWPCQGMGCGIVKAWGVALSRHGVWHCQGASSSYASSP